MKARQIIDTYVQFFEHRDHKRIPMSPLVPDNDPTTLFTSSGMQPLIPYLLGEEHSSGKRLVNVQNAFRAVDIDEVGNNRHTTFFRMLGNWSLGDYFKKEQLPWVFAFLTKDLGLDPKKLFVSVFNGYQQIPKDEESILLWKELFRAANIEAKEGERIFPYGVEKNWWSRSGTPDKMPTGEPGGPDSEVFYDFGEALGLHEKSSWRNEKCHINCDCGRFWEIGNSVFMQYQKQENGTFKQLPKQNVDFGGGLERFIGVTENQPDMFQTSLFSPTIAVIAELTEKRYENAEHRKAMQIVADHFGGSMFMIAAGVTPSNKEQGYILRRLIRRSLDHLWTLKNAVTVTPILETITQQYKETDPDLVEKFESISLTILEEEQIYKRTLSHAKKLIEKDISNPDRQIDKVKKEKDSQQEGTAHNDLPGIKLGDELMGTVEISADTAFKAISSYGLSPTQLKSLGYTFNNQELAEKIKEHQYLSRQGAQQKFSGGLADHKERTIMGHTATHLLQQALREVLGNIVHQTGSNITTERLRFDFNFERKLTDEELQRVERIVNDKITSNLPVHFEMLPLKTAKAIGAIGLFDEKYQNKVKVYFIGGSGKEGDHKAYSKEFCGGPHVDFTIQIKSFRIKRQEKIGANQQRIYAIVDSP
ncbi:MAG TPA: alanine--tRNA ligase-related protein [Patescibacteria group bacterium]|nr:alanine--tRNA ligase-related protein [Patescibacteria group bacterium]